MSNATGKDFDASRLVGGVDTASKRDFTSFCISARTMEEAETWARLSRAAPEMLAVLQQWDKFFTDLTRDDEPGDPLAQMRWQVHGDRVLATRAAIAKATTV